MVWQSLIVPKLMVFVTITGPNKTDSIARTDFTRTDDITIADPTKLSLAITGFTSTDCATVPSPNKIDGLAVTGFTKTDDITMTGR
jgi:hypothetical protein